jgi:hypothetical protein
MENADTALVLRNSASDDQVPKELQKELQVGLADTRERLGIPDPDSPEVSRGVAELEHLRLMLQEQEHATLELRLQLASQAETARPKNQYYGAPKSRDLVTRVEAEVADLRTQLHAAKKALDWEQRSRRADSAQASARIHALEQELAVASPARAESSQKGHPMRLRIALGVATAVALAASVAAIAMQRQIPVTAHEALVASAETPAKNAPDFTGSYNRLGQALAALPGRDPEDVLRQVQKSGQGCALRWNNGEPSLMFGSVGNAAKPNSLEAALTQCAEAVEKLH